jgi:RNA polymerase sigma-70 factor (ECF subfamily)
VAPGGRRVTAPPDHARYRVDALAPGDPVPEHELIERARAGDEEAFAGLVLVHADRVYGALRRLGLDADEANDVTQLSTWLYRIAFNEAQRRLSRRETPRVEPQLDGEDPVLSIPEAPQLGPEARALDHEFEALLERALAKLPADWRAAVVLRDIEGLSTEQAAAVVGVRQAAFKSRLHRGRMQLRGLLEPYLELEEG